MIGSGCSVNGSGGCQRDGRAVDRGLRFAGLGGDVAAGFFTGSMAIRVASALRVRRSSRRRLFVRSRPMADSSIEPTVLRMAMVLLQGRSC